MLGVPFKKPVESIFLIGLSGVGKSTLAKEVLKHLPSSRVIGIDGEGKKKNPLLYSRTREDWESFWELALKCITELEAANGGDILIFDICAGCLESKHAFRFFKSRNTVLVYDSPENTFKKVQSRSGNAWMNETFSKFKTVEFSSVRQSIYGVSRHCINIGTFSLDEAVKNLIGYIQQSMGGAR